MSIYQYNVPVRADVLCHHCSGEIQATAQVVRGLQISGLSEYEWVHVDTGRAECPPLIRTARPYDGWRATTKVRAALAARRAVDVALADALDDDGSKS